MVIQVLVEVEVILLFDDLHLLVDVRADQHFQVHRIEWYEEEVGFIGLSLTRAIHFCFEAPLAGTQVFEIATIILQDEDEGLQDAHVVIIK